jgi:hypothetical protein
MPTQSSGPISFQNLSTFFGAGEPVSLRDYYRNGTHVPDITANDHVPTAGAISLESLYDTWERKVLAFTITVGSHAVSGKGTYFGYGNLGGGVTFGSISANSFLTPNGTMTITGLYFNTTSHEWHLQLGSTSVPANDDQTFRSVSVTGYTVNGVRASAHTTQSFTNARRWNWATKSTSHPTSGTINCSISYYG